MALEGSEKEHDFGALTPYERALVERSHLMHVALEVYKAGLPRGKAENKDLSGLKPFYSPQLAVQKALELIRAVDDHIVTCRKPEPPTAGS